MDEQPSSAPNAGTPLPSGVDSGGGADRADTADRGVAAEDVEFRAHLARVRAHRAELAESLRATDDALASAPGEAWHGRLQAALTELSHDLRDHVEITEGDRGFYARVRHAAPRLATPIDRLLGEHRHQREQIDGLLAALERDGGATDPATFTVEVSALIAQLHGHRHRGRDLVHEAYDIDLGGSG